VLGASDEREEKTQENCQVAHSLSAQKRVRQNEKHKARNKARKLAIKDQAKAFAAALHAGDFTKAEGELNKLTQKVAKPAEAAPAKPKAKSKEAGAKKSTAAKKA
jgi:ribosomal protein S20